MNKLLIWATIAAILRPGPYLRTAREVSAVVADPPVICVADFTVPGGFARAVFVSFHAIVAILRPGPYLRTAREVSAVAADPAVAPFANWTVPGVFT